MSTPISIAAGASQQIKIPAGSTITLTGSGSAQIVPPVVAPGNGDQRMLQRGSPAIFGPYLANTLINVIADAGMGGVSGLVSGFSSGVSYMLFQSGVPLIVLSAATNISATGAITGLTALPYTPAGVVMVYCFAQAGLPSGIYFARFSSATACQLYTDDAGVIAPSGITPGAYSPTTATTSILTLPVLGNMIGPNGLMEVTADWIRPNTVNAMTITMMFGADPAITGTATTASTFGGRTTYRIRNRGVATRQIRFHPAGSNPGYAGTSIQTTTDTTVDQQMTLQVALSNTADFVILEGFSIEIQPSP